MVQNKNVELLRSDIFKIYEVVELIQQGRISAYFTAQEQFENMDRLEHSIIRLTTRPQLGEAIEHIGLLLRYSYQELYMLKAYQKRTTMTTIINKAMTDAVNYCKEWESYDHSEATAIFEVETNKEIAILYRKNVFERYTRLMSLIIAFILVCLTDFDIQ